MADEDIKLNVKVQTGSSVQEVNNLSKEVDGLTGEATTASGRFTTMASKIGDAGKKMTAMALAGGGLIAMLANSAGKMQSMEVALNTSFGGDKSAAGLAMQTIQAFADKTPYALNEVLQGFLKLKNMGLDPSTEALESYGNTASAMGKSLNDMVEAVADAATGEFERLKEFGIRASAQGDDVAFTFQGVTTTVKKNSEDIQKYLLSIGNVQFAGGMEAQSKTFFGVMSTMQDSITKFVNAIGTPLLEPLSAFAIKLGELATKMTTFLQANPALAEFAGKVLLLGTGILAVLGPLAIFASLLPAIGAGLFLLASPWTLIVVGIMALVAAIAYLVLKWDEFKTAVVTVVGMMVDFVIEKFEALKSFMQNHMSFLYNAIVFGWNAIMLFIQPFLALFELLFTGSMDRTTLMYTTTLDNIKNIFVLAWQGIKNVFQMAWDGIVFLVGAAWERIKLSARMGLDAILAFMNFMIEPYVNVFNVIWGAIGGGVTGGAGVVLEGG